MMHSAGDSSIVNTVPAFLTKLWTLVEDESTNELICWDPSGNSFHVLEQARFAKEILPLYFKHNNMASFIRQLNMYGFRKVVCTEPMYVKAEKDDVEFAHQYFVRGQECLLESIKRKVSAVTSRAVSEELLKKDDDLHQVLTEVTQMKGKQDNLSSRLETLKIENEMLWREVASLRQQHNNQSQVVKKLINFLVTLMSKKRAPTLSGLKRKMPLMLKDGPSGETSQSSAKMSRLASDREYIVQSPGSSDGTTARYSENKMTIREVVDNGDLRVSDTVSSDVKSEHTVASNSNFDQNLEPLALLEDDDDIGPSLAFTDLLASSSDTVDTSLLYSNWTGASAATGATAATGLSSGPSFELNSKTTPSKSVASQPLSKMMTVAISEPILNTSDFDKVDLGSQLDALQANIDNIREMFSCGQYNFDTSTLFGLFDPEASVPSAPSMLYDLPDLGLNDEESLEASSKSTSETQTGKEVMKYVPQDDFSSLFQDMTGFDTSCSTLDESAPESTPLVYHLDMDSHLSSNDLDSFDQSQSSIT